MHYEGTSETMQAWEKELCDQVIQTRCLLSACGFSASGTSALKGHAWLLTAHVLSSPAQRRTVLGESLELAWGFWSNQSPCKFCSSDFNGESKFPGRFHDSTFVP